MLRSCRTRRRGCFPSPTKISSRCCAGKTCCCIIPSIRSNRWWSFCGARRWIRTLEAAGVHVVYGLVGLKVHSKVALVVRREGEAIRRYVHLGTGNYNPITARLYTDLSFFTTDEAIGADVTDLFNYVTGYSAKREFHKLLVAPINL